MTSEFKPTNYNGLLIIGDPHLESRVPGFRKDDYPNVILEKLRWSLNYAASDCLLPAILGDLFHLPRDNPNWMLGKLMEMFDGDVIAIYGNHDVHENQINDDDSLSVLVHAGRMQLLDDGSQFFGIIGGQPIIVGGTPWGQRLPSSYDIPQWVDGIKPLVFWLAHHDIVLPGYEELGRFKPMDLPGIDVVVNGHIHRRLDAVRVGHTQWITPGNISRRSRSDATREHIPSVMRIDVNRQGWSHVYVEVPHRPFDEVFHEVILEDVATCAPSAFVAGLAELQGHRTQTGEGLIAFLDRNFHRFEDDVTCEVRRLAQEVLRNG